MVLKTKLISFQNFFLFFVGKLSLRLNVRRFTLKWKNPDLLDFFGRKMFSLNNRRIPVSDFEIKLIFIKIEEKRKKLLN